MHMIGQDDPGVDLKRARAAGQTHGMAQGLNLAQQKVRTLLGQTNGQKDRGTGYFGTDIV